MLSKEQLSTIAKSRLSEARILHRARKYDGAIYLCGYAVEIALKKKMCQALSWKGFPETKGEFDGLEICKIHKLDILLKLSGQENLKRDPIFKANWSTATTWDSEARYKPIGKATKLDSKNMITSCRDILKALKV